MTLRTTMNEKSLSHVIVPELFFCIQHIAENIADKMDDPRINYL